MTKMLACMVRQTIVSQQNYLLSNLIQEGSVMRHNHYGLVLQ